MSFPKYLNIVFQRQSNRHSLVRLLLVILLVFTLLLSGCQSFLGDFVFQIRSDEGRESSTASFSSTEDSIEPADASTLPAVSENEATSSAPSSESGSIETSPEPSGSSAETETPTVSLTPTPTTKPAATSAPVPSSAAKPTATATPVPTNTPNPTATPTLTPTPIVVPTTGTYQSAMANEVIALVNEERAAVVGLSALSSNSQLTSAADIRSPEIIVYWSHTRPNGLSCFTAISGLSYSTAGENIAMGYVSASAVMAGWMESPGHKANILNPDFTMIGVSCYLYEGTYYWVQFFAG